jgi:hypothetical protein
VHSTHNLVEVGGVEILKVVRVRNLAGRPGALVRRVVDQRSRPLALVSGVRLHRADPGTATRTFSTLGVRDGGRDPVTVLLVIPLLRLLSVGIGDGEGFLGKPALGLASLFIRNLARSILIPVLGFGGSGISDLVLVDPVGRLLVLGIVDFLGWVDWRLEALEKVTLGIRLVVNEDLEGVVGAICILSNTVQSAYKMTPT